MFVTLQGINFVPFLLDFLNLFARLFIRVSPLLENHSTIIWDEWVMFALVAQSLAWSASSVQALALMVSADAFASTEKEAPVYLALVPDRVATLPVRPRLALP